MEINLISPIERDISNCRSDDSSTSAITEANEEYANPAESSLSSIASCRVGKKVTFSTLQIREYAIIPGDNPGVSCGCPISIGWDFDGEFCFSIEEYEEQRAQPRSMTELSMPSRVREDMLRGVGYSRKEIQESTKHANVARLQRRRTSELMHLAPIQELLERAKRKTLHLVGAGAKRKERKLMRSIPGDPSLEKYPRKNDGNLRKSTETAPLDASLVSFASNEY